MSCLAMSSFDFVKTLFTHLYETLCSCWFDDIGSLEGVETVYEFDTIWLIILVDFIVCRASVLKPFIDSLLKQLAFVIEIQVKERK